MLRLLFFLFPLSQAFLLMTTQEMLKDRWSQKLYKTYQPIVQKDGHGQDDMTQWVCPQGNTCVYVAQRTNKVVSIINDGTRVFERNTPGHVTSIALRPQCDIIACGHYSPDKKYFTVSLCDMTSTEWKETSVVNTFPMNHVFFYGDTTLFGIASHGRVARYDMTHHNVTYIDLSFVVRNVQMLGRELFFDTRDGLSVHDIEDTLLLYMIPIVVDVCDTISSFAVSTRGDNIVSCLVTTTLGKVFCIDYDKQLKITTQRWNYNLLSHVIASSLDGYKYVLASSDGRLIIGDARDGELWHTIKNVFIPSFFKQMYATHRRIYCDATPNGFEYLDWF